MAVVTRKSTQITNAEARPIIRNTSTQVEGEPVENVAYVNPQNGDSANSIYRLGRVRSGDRLAALQLANTAGTTCASNDFGLYDIEGGAVVNATLFAHAIDLTAARTTFTGLIPGSSGATLTIANSEQRIWELLGLAQDPFKEYDLAITANNNFTVSNVDVSVKWTVVR